MKNTEIIPWTKQEHENLIIKLRELDDKDLVIFWKDFLHKKCPGKDTMARDITKKEYEKIPKELREKLLQACRDNVDHLGRKRIKHGSENT